MKKVQHSLLMMIAIILMTIQPTYANESVIITRDNIAQIAQLAVLDTQTVGAIAMSPINNTLMVATETELWQYSLPDLTATRIMTFPDEVQFIQRIEYSPDAQYITLLDKASLFYTLDIAKRAIISTIDTYKQKAVNFDYHPTQTFIAFVTRDGEMGIVDALTGDEVQYGSSLSLSDLLVVTYSPSGNWIGIGTWNDIVILYEYMDETEWGADFAWLRSLIFTTGLQGHAQDITAIAFSPDEHYVLTGGFSRLVVWNIVNNGRVQSLRFENWVTNIIYSHNGDMLIVADADGQLWFLDSTTYAEIATFEAHQDWIFDLAISPDGRYLVSVSYDNVIQVWGVSG